MAKLNLRDNSKNSIKEQVEKFVYKQVQEAWMPPVPFILGKSYIIRTINMCDIGTVIRVVGNFIELDDDAVWVANAGSWKALLENKLDTSTIFKFRHITGVNTSSIVDYTEWKWAIPDGV
jgi:hypothetical protein